MNKTAMPSPIKLFCVFVLLLLMIVFAGIGYFQLQRNYIVRYEQDKLATVAELRVDQIVRWRNERLNHVEYIYNNPLFARLVKAFFENPDSAERRQEILAWMKALQTRRLFTEIYLLDANGGQILASKDAGQIGEHAKGLIKQVLATRTPVFSDLHTAPKVNLHFPHFDIAIPLILPENQSVAGVIFMRMIPQTDLYEQINSWPTPSITAETILVRRDGDCILYLNDLRHRKGGALNLRIPLTDNNVAEVKAVNGTTGIIKGVDYRGVPVLAVARTIPDTSWIMIAKIDKKEIYAPLREQTWVACTGVFILVIGAAVAVRFWWWRQRSRFYLELYNERKNSEAKVRQLAALVENSSDSIFAMTLDGIITSWNKGAETSFGYKECEVFGKSIDLLIPSDNQNETTALIEKIKAGERIEYYEITYRCRSGKKINLSLSISPVLDNNGKITGISFIGRDITAIRQIEGKLHKSEGEYRTLFESSRDAIMMLDRNGFLDCNKATLELFGLSSKTQLVKKHPSELSAAIQPDGQDSLTAARKHIEKAFSEGADFFEWTHTRLDGTPFRAEVLLSRLQGNGVLQASVRDITSRVRIENELRRYREELEEQVRERTAQLYNANQTLARATEEWQTTFDNISDAVALLSKEGKILKCNAAMERIFGNTATEIIGRHCFEVVHGALAPVDGCPFILASRSLRRESMELTVGERKLMVFVDPLLDQQGKFNGGVHIISDITELHKVTAKLQELNDAKDRFFSIIGHDLKNMFHNIMGLGDLLKDDIKAGNIETIESEIRMINSSTSNAYNMLLSLMEWTNAQRGNTLFSPELLVLNEVINEELTGLNVIAQQKSIELKITVPDNFKVTADKEMLKIILRNLINNAIKFSYRGGQIELRAVAGSDKVEIFVSDNGTGMNQDAIQKLFNLSASYSTRGTENERGTGMGLLLCAEFVKKHGGEILVESTAGKGSAFKFTLPNTVELVNQS